MSLAGLELAYEWEAAPGVEPAELRETWARLEIRIAGETVSLVEDERAAAMRRSIYVPLYPLAEWCAFNWWFLDSHSRPRVLPLDRWSYRNSNASASQSWLSHHNLRGVGDGYPWPDLALVPSDGSMRAAWWGYRSLSLRYLSSGRAVLDVEGVRDALARFIDDVIERLDDRSVDSTVLAREWEAIRSMDQDEADFCRAAARLGLDPLAVSESTADLLLEADASLTEALFQDFVNAADPSALESDLAWTSRSVQIAEQQRTGGRTGLPQFKPDSPLLPLQPWTTGYTDARLLRERLGLQPRERLELDQYVLTRQHDGASRGIRALGHRSRAEANVLVSPREESRFDKARALWRFARSNGPFLISNASTPLQRAERAFAAELLAPAAGLAPDLPIDRSELIDPDTVSTLATRFAVSERIIELQAKNHFGLDVEGPADWDQPIDW